MQSGTLRALEFDRVVESVTSFAMTPMGADRLSRLAPSTDPNRVAQLLAATTETVKFVATNGVFPLRGSADLPQILGALAVEGRPLEGPRLLTLVAFLESIDETRAAIRRGAAALPLGGG
jgi:dsDNA-specific endonuclease/ATPase MutS2